MFKKLSLKSTRSLHHLATEADGGGARDRGSSGQPHDQQQQQHDAPGEEGPELENALSAKSWTLARRCIAQQIGTRVKGVFHLAIRQQAPEDVVASLLELHPHLASEPQDGYEGGNWYPLLLAVRFAPHLLPVLLSQQVQDGGGVNVNCALATGENAVLLACRESAGVDVVRTLVEAGCSVNAKRNDGLTALMVSVLRGDLPMVDLLLSAGAEVDVGHRSDTGTALCMAVVAGKTDNNDGVALVQRLLLARANANLASQSGETPVLGLFNTYHHQQSASAAGLPLRRTLQLLIQAGADVDAANSRGETPLCVAAEKNVDPELVRLLLQAGADVNKSSGSGMTPILFAVIRGASSELARLLLENGAVVDGQAKFQGQTALEIAQTRGYAHLASLLQLCPPHAVNTLDVPASEYAFCAQCRKSSSNGVLAPCACGLVAYCSASCEQAHAREHQDRCRRVQDTTATPATAT